MTATGVSSEPLPPLPLEEWEPTKDTLHLWVQIVGKVRLRATSPRNHWWHVPLYLSVRGLTTRRMHASDGRPFQIDFDFLEHRLVVWANGGRSASFELRDGLSVAEFDTELHRTMTELGVDVEIVEKPFGVPMKTPFPEDREHASYDRSAVERFWRILDFSDGVFEQFAGWYCGKTSPVHFFWHSFDLAVTRFSGERAPPLPEADPVTREAYSHEVVSFGFWAGDANIREPSYYAYAAPEPAGLRDRPLRPGAARWTEMGGGSMALLPYDSVRGAAQPERQLLQFLESAYRAGAGASGWDIAGLTSSWCPAPRALAELLEA